MPVAVIIMSADTFSPDSSRMPSDTNCDIWSVTTEALLFLIAYVVIMISGPGKISVDHFKSR